MLFSMLKLVIVKIGVVELTWMLLGLRHAEDDVSRSRRISVTTNRRVNGCKVY